MKQAPNTLYKLLRWLVLASACLALPAMADDYSDVNQLIRTSKFSDAMTRVDSYLASKPADPQMRFLKGVILRHLGKTPDAIATFTQLTQDYPELPEPYNNLAVLYAAQGQYDKARLALEMAIRTNPSYATAHENLGDVYARLATQAYNKALQLDGGSTAVPPKLALIDEMFKPNLGNSRATASQSAPAAVAAPVAKPAPEPVAPAVKPAAVTASTAVTAVASPAANSPAPQSVPLDPDANKAVEVAVLAWAKAWSDKDTTSYLKAYSPDFTPAGKQTLVNWEKERRSRIADKKSISVTLTNLKIRVQGDQAVAGFRQAYKADSLAVASQKTLNLKKSGQQWLITRETTGR